MKKYILIFILLSVIANAQINRFTYQYKFIPDSTNKANVEKKLMVLDISKKGSKYFNDRNRIELDSIADEAKKKIPGNDESNIGSRRSMTNSRTMVMGGKNEDVTIVKEYPNYTTYLVSNISMDTYKVKEDKKLVWKILPDKQKVGEYIAQKATTQFGGREWAAWFSTDLPFQDGPYKFSGLPGLIIKIEDKTGSHIMILIGNEKIKENDLPEQKFALYKGSEIEASKDKFKKALKEYNDDPGQGLKKMISQARNSALAAHPDAQMQTTSKVIMNGKEVSMDEVYKTLGKVAKEQNAKNNNPIEFDSAK